MARKKKKIETIVISATQLLIHSPGKLNSSDPKVRRGCGAHRSEKDYQRKRKKQKTRKILSDYDRNIKSLMFAS